MRTCDSKLRSGTPGRPPSPLSRLHMTAGMPGFCRYGDRTVTPVSAPIHARCNRGIPNNTVTHRVHRTLIRHDTPGGNASASHSAGSGTKCPISPFRLSFLPLCPFSLVARRSPAHLPSNHRTELATLTSLKQLIRPLLVPSLSPIIFAPVLVLI